MLFLIRLLFAVLRCFPVTFRLRLVAQVIRTVTLFLPNYRKVSEKNLAHAFPEISAAEREAIYQKNFTELARLIVDFGRMSSLTPEWMRKNITFDQSKLQALRNAHPNRPALYATGHLGSFELMAYSVSMLGYPLNFIVRNFSLPKLDAWWSNIREQYGNHIISRKGAVFQLFNLLGQGKDCAMLFDQNVKRNYAVFVPWFQKPAATTFALGLAAVKSRALVIVASIKFRHADQTYEIVTTPIPCDDIYDNQEMTHDQKVLEITARAARGFEMHIRNFPEGWFWMHRRWKTQPIGAKEWFYTS